MNDTDEFDDDGDDDKCILAAVIARLQLMTTAGHSVTSEVRHTTGTKKKASRKDSQAHVSELVQYIFRKIYRLDVESFDRLFANSQKKRQTSHAIRLSKSEVCMECS